MSWKALDWAEEAPVADVYERVILMQMASRADKDGCGVWLSTATLARQAVCDEQTVKRRLTAMRNRGLIAYGDQTRADRIPANRRPKVYDLMIPASSYTKRELDLVNEERHERDYGPITTDNRPDLADVQPSRKTRTDFGVPKDPKQPMTGADFQGGLVDTPPVDTPEESRGVYQISQGGLVDKSRGVYQTPKPVRENQSEEARPLTTTAHARNTPPSGDSPSLFAVEDSSKLDPDDAAGEWERKRRPSKSVQAMEQANAMKYRPGAAPIVAGFEARCAAPMSRKHKAGWLHEVAKMLELGYTAEVVGPAMDRCVAEGGSYQWLENKCMAVANQPRLAASKRVATSDQRMAQGDEVLARLEARQVLEGDPFGVVDQPVRRAIGGSR